MKSQLIIPKSLFNIILAASLISLISIGCGDSSTDADTEEFDVQTVSTQSHGEVLADGEGNVLYFFTPDVSGESTCEDDCIQNWPVFHTDELNISEGLTPSQFDSITRPDGSSQSTFKGWPLYYFVGDEQPEDINGDGLNGIWYVAKPDYSIMIADKQLVGADGNNYTSNYEQGEEITSYLTDAEGRTLYIFTNDEANTNNCTSEGCIENWPVYHVDIASLPSDVNEQNFGEITAHGDRPQLTYKGWPVYYFAGDEVRGDTRGVSVPSPGVWPVIQEDTPAAPGYEENNNDDNNGGDGNGGSGNDDTGGY